MAHILMDALQALIFGINKKSILRAEEVTGDAQVASRSFTSLERACSMIATKRFDILLIEASVPLSAQKVLAAMAWKKNAMCTVLAFDFFNLVCAQGTDIIFYGGELALGERCHEKIQSAITKITEKLNHTIAPFRIQLVEDDESSREIIESFIETIGHFQVESFPDARLALGALEENPERFDAVVTDIRMQHFDGKMLIEAIRRHPKLSGLPVIALTAYGTTDMLIECLTAGASGFIVKPPKKEDLLRELGRARRIKNGQLPARLVANTEETTLQEYFQRRDES